MVAARKPESNDLTYSQMDTSFVKDFKEIFINGLRSRVLSGEYWLSDCMIATALDPTDKKLSFLSEVQRNQISAKVDGLLCDNEPTTPATPQIKQEADKTPPNQSTLQFLLRDMIDLTTPDDVQTDEYARFVSQNFSMLSNPLLLWQMNGSIFPKLPKLARLYLAIPGTSVPSEHVFSTTGLRLNHY